MPLRHWSVSMIRLGLVAFLCSLSIISSCQTADTLKTADSDLRAMAVKIAGNGTNEEKVQRLVTWVNTNLEWVGTDYVKRSPEEILQRRAGNCADLASVLRKLLDYIDIHP